MAGTNEQNIQNRTVEELIYASDISVESEEVVKDHNERIGTRQIIAIGMFLFICVLIFSLLLIQFKLRMDVKDFVTMTSAILGPIIGIFGTVIGFYFGSPTSHRKNIDPNLNRKK